MKVDLNVQKKLNIENESPFMFKLCLCTQAGTYVKEFVNGDFGRTNPNLCSILNCDVDIIALDVEVRKYQYMRTIITHEFTPGN